MVTILEARWTDGYWWSKDGLRLHYRDYPGPSDKPPILCLPGLTRNVRDFADVADRLAGSWRLIVVEQRGRGESAYAKDPMSYVPLTYLQDVEALIDTLGLGHFIVFGTSLGGMLAMLLSATGPGRLAGALLNDIGPVLEIAGLTRIRSYVGRSGSWPTWVHAARALAEVQGASYPEYALEDWLVMAKRLCRLTSSGKIVLDYDMKIAEPFRLPGDAAMDLWPALQSLEGVPSLLVRGALSDVLSEETASEMVRRLPLMDYLTVPAVGHAPTLDEPPCRAAIDRLLDRIERAI
ncbi:alpha/beta hydrolase [Sphingomonas oleivorans]|uniref:Alpha/beta hydrolase n=1 Tax=Sphingomonas oleivorans TaxID=1735121 RepID=A0A2T5FVV5_9SPHN|nr:alpha/beta hydrolase [Sphingomonas oleivorans]PTQ09902.1 alpha/beta hydrolase [Sphingomonas oleivorans]